MFKKLKENNKKGFTLVELIVVLVILAILAALLIPALTGYIDKARNKSIVAETRQTVMAAQTLVDEQYANNAANASTAITVAPAGTVTYDEVRKLAETTGKISSVEVNNDGKITSLTYSNGGRTCTYSSVAQTNSSDGNYNVTKGDTPEA